MNFLELLRTPTSITISDYKSFALYCVAIFIFRFIMSKFILVKIAKHLKIKKTFKFIHRGYDMIHYVTSAVVGLLSVTQSSFGRCVFWANNCRDELLPTNGAFVCTFIEKAYYYVFTGYYVVDIFYIYTASEILMMICHHTITLTMIFLSTIAHLPGICLSIMLLHDVVDVPLYVGKILLYCGKTISKDISFVIFAISCTYFRIINFPGIIYYTMINTPLVIDGKWAYVIASWLLFVLYALHLIWEYKIITNVVGIIKGEKIHDNRSDKAE